MRIFKLFIRIMEGPKGVIAGGHEGGISFVGDFVEKKVKNTELKAYETIFTKDEAHPLYAQFQKIKAFTADYAGKVDGGGEEQKIRLSNLLIGFENPSLLDIKVGRVTFPEYDSEAKKERMHKKVWTKSAFMRTSIGFAEHLEHAWIPHYRLRIKERGG